LNLHQVSEVRVPASSPSQNARLLERFARNMTNWTGSTMAFVFAAGTVVVWGMTGPLFQFSDTWQLVINTGTTVVTFLMVFLIQRAQNKDALAVHVKLNELVAAVQGASNRLVNVEDLSESELRQLHEFYVALAAMAKKDHSLGESHTVEEAEHRHEEKRESRRRRRAEHLAAFHDKSKQ
jgi:low affinity Fe/Cu permease